MLAEYLVQDLVAEVLLYHFGDNTFAEIWLSLQSFEKVLCQTFCVQHMPRCTSTSSAGPCWCNQSPQLTYPRHALLHELVAHSITNDGPEEAARAAENYFRAVRVIAYLQEVYVPRAGLGAYRDQMFSQAPSTPTNLVYHWPFETYPWSYNGHYHTSVNSYEFFTLIEQLVRFVKMMTDCYRWEYKHWVNMSEKHLKHLRDARCESLDILARRNVKKNRTWLWDDVSK